MSKFSTALTASLLALAVGLAAAGPTLAEDQVTFGAPYLRMGVGPRALAMGGAYVAAAEDVTAGYWNPAGLMEIDWIEASFMYSDMSLDRNYNYFGYGHHLAFGAIGFTWINAGVSDIKVNRTGWSGNEDYKDNALLFSYGTGLGGISIGGSAKILMSKFGDESDTGFGIDGAVRFTPSNTLAIGILVQDIGTQYWGEEVPTNLRVGLAINSPDQSFTIAADAEKESEQEVLFHLGGEIRFMYIEDNCAALRAGMRSGREGQEEDTVFSFGAGITFGQASLDYAYLPEQQDFMDSSHRISLTGRF